MKEFFHRKTNQIIEVLTVIILSVFFVVQLCLFFHGFDSYQDAGFLYSFASKVERIMLAAIAFVFVYVLYHILGIVVRKCSDRVLFIIQIALWVLFVSGQLFFLFYIRSYYKWDSGFVIGAAASLAEGRTVADEAFYYLSVYPNQNTFVVITAVLVKMCNLLGVSVVNRPFVFNLFNTFGMDLTIALGLAFARKMWLHTKKDSLFIHQEMTKILILLFFNPFFYMGVSYYYTITLSWPFTMGFIYCVFLPVFSENISTKEKKNTILSFVLGGILLGIGFELRATAIIFAIAAFVIAVLRGIRKKDFKKTAVKIAIVFFSAFLSAASLSHVQKNYVGIDTTDTAFPSLHWVMMSLTQPGGHNADDESFTASFATKEEKSEAVKSRMVEKLKAMGVRGYLDLVKIKIDRTFGDGMNGYTTFLADGYGTGKIYDCIFGNHKDFVVLWHQGYFLFFMFGILVSTANVIVAIIRQLQPGEAEKDVFDLLKFFLLVLIGAYLFYVLWEASEQYSVPFMMVMLFAGFMGMYQLEAFISKRQATQYKHARGMMMGLGLIAVIILGWGIYRTSNFAQTAYAQSYPVASQILANAPTVVDDGEVLVQCIDTKQAFNHLVMQWRNPQGEENDSVYELVFENESGSKQYLKTEIVASEGGYNGAGVYDFETQVNAGKSQISIRKISGSENCDLQFVLYDMYGYTPYPGGGLSMKRADGTQEELTASMLFLVSEEVNRTYCSMSKYIFFIAGIFLIFIFMGICCKLEEIGLLKKESFSPE